MSNPHQDPAADPAEWENSYTDGARDSWEAEPPIDEATEEPTEEPTRPECFGTWNTICSIGCVEPHQIDCWFECMYIPWLKRSGHHISRPPSAEEQIETGPAQNEES